MSRTFSRCTRCVSVASAYQLAPVGYAVLSLVHLEQVRHRQMGLNIVHKATQRPPIFYGWLIVTIAFVMAFVMAGSGSAFGVFVIPMSAEFAWNRSIISMAFLFSTLVSGLAQPFLGHLCDRF